MESSKGSSHLLYYRICFIITT